MPTINPLDSAGETSDRYSGTNVTKIPIAKPMIKRLTTNIAISTEPVISAAATIASKLSNNNLASYSNFPTATLLKKEIKTREPINVPTHLNTPLPPKVLRTPHIIETPEYSTNTVNAIYNSNNGIRVRRPFLEMHVIVPRLLTDCRGGDAGCVAI
jgi:hypothetical protein